MLRRNRWGSASVLFNDSHFYRCTIIIQKADNISPDIFISANIAFIMLFLILIGHNQMAVIIDCRTLNFCV